MAKKEFSYRGKTLEELKQMSVKQLAELFPARVRRSLNRGMNDTQKKILSDLNKGKKEIKTHCRGMIILPQMVGITFKVHGGKQFQMVRVEPEMIGHRLGEFALTRNRVSHSAPGIGATRSSSSLSVR
jgi:small subunit ribosomal protein S19